MYNYCQDGWPVSVEEASSGTIVVYPNPTESSLTIDTRLDVEVEIWDMAGKKVLTTNERRIDMSDLNSGVYNLIIIYNSIRVNKRVIKQ